MRRKRGARIVRDTGDVAAMQVVAGDAQLQQYQRSGHLSGDLAPSAFARVLLAAADHLQAAATPAAIAAWLLSHVPPGKQLLANHLPVTARAVLQMAHRLEREGLVYLERGGSGRGDLVVRSVLADAPSAQIDTRPEESASIDGTAAATRTGAQRTAHSPPTATAKPAASAADDVACIVLDDVAMDATLTTTNLETTMANLASMNTKALRDEYNSRTGKAIKSTNTAWLRAAVAKLRAATPAAPATSTAAVAQTTPAAARAEHTARTAGKGAPSVTPQAQVVHVANRLDITDAAVRVAFLDAQPSAMLRGLCSHYGVPNTGERQVLVRRLVAVAKVNAAPAAPAAAAKPVKAPKPAKAPAADRKSTLPNRPLLQHPPVAPLVQDGVPYARAMDAPKAGKPYQHDPRVPAVGTVIEREWKGVTHKVLVAPTGFNYCGFVYRSLSPVAEIITQTMWYEGKVFFGLVAHKAPATVGA